MTEQQLRRWEALGLIDRCDAYSLRDLAKLRKISDLAGSGVSSSRLKKTIHALAMREHVSDPLSELRIFATESGAIEVEVQGQKMDAASGQFLMNFDSKPKPEFTTVAFPVAKSADASKKRGEAENWFERGLELEQTGAPQPEIRAAYEKAVSLDPDSTGALVNLGTLYFNSRALAKAEKFYLRAIQVDPNYALAHFNLGNLYDDRGDVEKAFHHYLEALRLHAAYPDAHYNLALLYQSQGQPMQAVQHWKAYLKLDPRSHWADIARRELEKLKVAAIVK